MQSPPEDGRPSAPYGGEDDLGLRPARAPPDPDSPLGRICGRDRYFYASLWAPAYIPGFTAEDLLDDRDPVEREAGAAIFDAFVRDMQFDHGREEYRRVVEEKTLPWGGSIDLETYAREWRPQELGHGQPSQDRSHLGNTGRKTGFWLEELAAPYYVFEDAGAPLSPKSPINGTR